MLREVAMSAMSAPGLGRVKTILGLERSSLGAVVIHGHYPGSTMPALPPRAVTTEMALHVLTYNLTRVMNIMGVQSFGNDDDQIGELGRHLFAEDRERVVLGVTAGLGADQMPQSEAGYIDARPLTANSTKFSCNARPDHTSGSNA